MSSQSRHVYTQNERMILEASFANQPHPNIHEKERLARLLNCNIIQISNWFQNYRRRFKKENRKTTKLNTNNESKNSVVYDTSYYQSPPTYCPYCLNQDYSSYSHPPPSSFQNNYSYESNYTQPIFFDDYVVSYNT
ncbi:hypothetical protein I4U23_020527 [Adineta vaga]|nr:hypothetical protein I4U23_020527 [Adineta vaga]